MRWSVIWDYREALLSGLAYTLAITALTMIGATLLGILVACLHQHPSYVVGRLAETYVEVIRNIPSVIKVFFLYFCRRPRCDARCRSRPLHSPE